MAPFGTGYRVASSSCDASLGGGSFINGSSFDRDNVLEYTAGRTGVPELRQERIVPGVSTAQLYLPDGKVVDLGKDSICDLQLFEGGRFVNERGTLTYKSDSAKISAAQYSEIRIPRGGEYKVVLPDGTVVW